MVAVEIGIAGLVCDESVMRVCITGCCSNFLCDGSPRVRRLCWGCVARIYDRSMWHVCPVGVRGICASLVMCVDLVWLLCVAGVCQVFGECVCQLCVVGVLGVCRSCVCRKTYGVCVAGWCGGVVWPGFV